MIELYQGDAVEELRTMPDGIANCCVTSPPYYGLRDYGHDGQIGLETTPDEYVAKLVDVFREVHRVLQDDGTLWLNLGDSYAATSSNNGGYGNKSTLGGFTNGNTKGRQSYENVKPRRLRPGVKPKDLLGIPWRVAFALQSDGWYLRQDIIWYKPNPMPESVRDRCTKAHEYIFLLSKSPKYYYDSDAIKEPLARPGESLRVTPAVFGGRNKFSEAQKQSRLHSGNEYKGTANGKRNKRSVWTITPKPYKGAHFAVFPPDLVEPCILAGCPAGGVVLDPFAGSGTTGQVAVSNGRRAVLIELNPDYIPLILGRVGMEVLAT